MSLRPPSTPRNVTPSTAGSTPSSLPIRRKSDAAALGRPNFSHLSLGNTSHELDSLQDALKKNDPGRYDSPQNGEKGSLRQGIESPIPSTTVDENIASPINDGAEERRRLALRRPSMMGLRKTALGRSISGVARPSSPALPLPRTPRARTPTGFGSSTSARPSSRAEVRLNVGDRVCFESGRVPMEGILRFVGEMETEKGGSREWAGVELDAEWAGRGKNNGSAQGHQYFECPPLCGLFLPLTSVSSAFVSSLPRPGSSASNYSSQHTPGFRTAKYTGVTTEELTRKRLMSSPTKLTPRRSTSPEKVALSKSLGMSTPRALRPRASVANLNSSTPRPLNGSTRQSVGTPRRPPSSMRNTPDVPPPPPSFSGTRSISSSVSGRAVSSRRLSMATDSSLSHSRPATPSGRSHSRASFASSLSRQSHISFGDDAEELQEARAKESEALQKMSEMQQLYEGSEKLGRETEDKLAEREDALKAALERVDQLLVEKERARKREEEKLAGAGDEEGARDREALRAQILEDQVQDLVRQANQAKAGSEKLSREWDTKFAVKSGEIESLRERMLASAREVEEARQETEKLRAAGQQVCQNFEGQIAAAENAHHESLDVIDALTLQLANKNNGRPGSPQSPSQRLSTSVSSSRASAADVIDAETALAELEHARSRIRTLEDQLEETQMHLESEVSDSRRRRQKRVETEGGLRKELKTLKELIDRTAKVESRFKGRIDELEEALLESQTALENERSELEVLRRDTPGGVPSPVAGSSLELQKARKQIETLKSEREAKGRELEEASHELSRNADLIRDLRSDLRSAEKEMDKQRVNGTLRPNPMPTTPTPDTPNLLLSSVSMGTRRDSVASSSSRRSIGGAGKDEATAARDTIVGLKAIISTMTEEGKQLEERNSALMLEAKHLRDGQRGLEATVDNLMAEMGNASQPSLAIQQKRASTLVLNSVALERQLDELKTALKDSESRSDRELHALNQEVQDLEAMVEDGIFREGELQAELQQLKSSCEMCGVKGHDLDACPDFTPASPLSNGSRARNMHTKSNGSGRTRERYCEDCQTHGHDIDVCPMSNETY